MTTIDRTWRVAGILTLIVLALAAAPALGAWAAEANPATASVNGYVGSEVCAQCHEEQYKAFLAYSKKARSFLSISKMRKGLTEEELRKCYECHTTGYGHPTGFRSSVETPGLKNAGCEVCHGPGSKHVKSEAAKDIKGNLTAQDCQRCHSAERVEAFKYRPLIYGGGH